MIIKVKTLVFYENFMSAETFTYLPKKKIFNTVIPKFCSQHVKALSHQAAFPLRWHGIL